MKIIVDSDFISINYFYENTLSSIEISNINKSSSLYDLNGNVWYFNRLIVSEKVRNKGIATKMMNELIKILDKYKIKLVCEVNPYGDLNRNQLIKFYKKFKFKDYDSFLLYSPK